MRDLNRNKQPLYYANLIGETPILDDDGYDSGETKPIYSEIVKASINRSPATGETVSQTFGDLPEYSMVLATTRNFPFDEKTVFWIDKPIDAAHDYKLVKVAKSLNSWLYALDRVEVK